MSTPVNWLTCRICCKKEQQGGQYIPVDGIDQNGLSIADMIYQLSDIMVTLESHLPQQICPACLDDLRFAHNFRQKCINSNATLSRMIANSSVNIPMQSDPQLMLVLKEEHIDPELEAEEVNLYDLMESEEEKPMETPEQRRSGSNRINKTPMQRQSRTKEGLGQMMKRKGSSLQSIANANVSLVNNSYACSIKDDVHCAYAQRKYDCYNFIRHFKLKHKEAAQKLGLIEENETMVKKPRAIAKQAVEIDAKYLIESSMKLIVFHNLPLQCFEWDGFQSLYKPLLESLKLAINGARIMRCIRHTFDRMVSRMHKEMSSKLVSILVDSAVRHGLHVLTVSSQFEFGNAIRTRVLGVIRVRAGHTAKQLRCKVEEILNQFGLTNGQIFAIIVENGTHMFATTKKLQKTFSDSVRDNVGEDTADGSEMDKADELLEALSGELRDQFTVIRGPIRTLLFALNDVLPDTDPNIFRFNRFALDLRDAKYDDFFDGREASYPPICTGNHRWTSKYKLIRSILKQKELFTLIAEKNPEIALHDHEWQYVQEFNEAFEPLYDIVRRMQQQHHTVFSEFYMQWLMAIKELRSKTGNRFSKPLTESLTKRVTVLREIGAFKACMYLDPRFNYCESVVFTGDQRDEMKNYIISIWNRIQSLKSGKTADPAGAAEVKQEDKKDDDMDDFLTEMFGGPSEGSSKALSITANSSITPILHQLKSLEIEPRQPHTYDVWQHWLQRADSHPDLFAVAMVVLSVPSNNVNLERAFSALVLSDRRNALSEKQLEELLLVRLNRTLFEKVVLSMNDWKQVLGA